MTSTNAETSRGRVGCTVLSTDPIAHGTERGAAAVQIQLGDPQSWDKPQVVSPGGAEALREAAAKADLAVYVHAPYVINVASPNNRLRIPSRKLLQQTVDLAAEVGARGVVVHGGHVTKNDDPAAGFANWRKAAEALEAKVPVFVENTAGGEHAMARTLDAIGRLWEAVGDHGLGFCLDTCHAFAAGLDLDTVVPDLLAITGRLDLVHANDSQGAAGSGRDRHANFGAGLIPADSEKAVLRAAAAAGADFLCETPGEAPAQAADIAWVRAALAE